MGMSGSLDSFDLTMTATRRPDLLKETLRSFHENLFQRVPVRCFFLNLDPIWGSAEDDRAVEEIARSYVSDVVIRRPAEASYGGAVKWLWSQPKTTWFLHLEDDWRLSHKINISNLTAQMARTSVVQIALGNYPRRLRLRKRPVLGVSPLFCEREFALRMSQLMNPVLDPDKQFRNGTNPALSQATQGKRALFFGNVFTPEAAIDIGRDWRAQRHINKAIVDGKAVWSTDEGTSV